MAEFDDEAFGGSWDAGGMVAEDLISWPIKNYLNKILEDDGYDISDFRRKFMSSAGAGILGTVLGVAFGGPIGILGGLLGFLTGATAQYPDDPVFSSRGNQSVDNELIREFLIKGSALKTASLAMKEHLSEEMWDEIRIPCKAVVDEFVDEDPSDTRENMDRFIRSINDTIASIDEHIADQWKIVFLQTVYEMDNLSQ